MTGNLDIWDRHADVDPKFTKQITGKPYKGTSPSPQHVIWCLTELFGPVGVGFGWRVLAEGFEPLGDEVLHWCRIEFWHTARENTFEAYGQTKALMKARDRMMSDEDAPKKSLTDAIVKASSQIGIAANIFLGRWDDAKYFAQVAMDFDDSPKPDSAAAPRTGKQPYNGRAVADAMLLAIANAPSLKSLGYIDADPKFVGDLAELSHLDEPKANEVRHAMAERKKQLTQKDAA